ncbi:MAG TPA: phage major capsid protein [Steroidobacteraceae bacterium]|jgi:HK97 family phage major capsid protein
MRRPVVKAIRPTNSNTQPSSRRGSVIQPTSAPKCIWPRRNIALRVKGQVETDVGSAGGYGLPKYISDQIESRVRQLNPLRQMATVTPIGTSDAHFLVSMGDGTSGWVSETGSRTATNATTLRDRAPTTGELYAYATASNWSLQDIQFDVQQWLVDDVAADFRSQEATAFLSGNGTNKPTGILNTAPVSTADSASPIRNADAIQYIALTSPGSPLCVNLDSFVDLVSTIAERYTMESDRCAFLMHRLTLASLRKLKASTAGSYLLEPDSQAGMPQRPLGFPVYTCDAMPTNVAGNIAAIFGNFRRGYLIVDRSPISITLDPYTTPGQTKFYVRKRVGGRILNNDAIKALKLA